jgi:hypothetical protein
MGKGPWPPAEPAGAQVRCAGLWPRPQCSRPPLGGAARPVQPAGDVSAFPENTVDCGSDPRGAESPRLTGVAGTAGGAALEGRAVDCAAGGHTVRGPVPRVGPRGWTPRAPPGPPHSPRPSARRLPPPGPGHVGHRWRPGTQSALDSQPLDGDFATTTAGAGSQRNRPWR